jgi:glycosyltransferase involved in cell wall biosynthesis
MRVLMTADCVGGVFGYAVELARELTRRGVAVTLAVLGEPLAPHQRDSLRGVRGLVFEERAGALEWMNEPWRDVDAAGEWLRELARVHAPSVLHLNGYAHAALDFGAPKLVVAHSCVLGWWRAVRGESAPDSYAEYARRVRAGLEAADGVVAPTHAMLATLLEEYGFRGGAVIPNGIEQSAFAPSHKQRYFVAAGRFWDPAKNLTALAAAAEELPWPLRIAGPCDEATPASERLELLGTLGRRELFRLFAGASALLHPARYEPFGLVPLEAAASGCALVLGDIPSLREVWGDTATYVPVDEPGAMVEVARRLARDDEACRRLGARAQSRARAYTAGAMAGRYLTMYRRLLDMPRSSAAVALQLPPPARGALREGKETST